MLGNPLVYRPQVEPCKPPDLSERYPALGYPRIDGMGRQAHVARYLVDIDQSARWAVVVPHLESAFLRRPRRREVRRLPGAG